jgi:2-amino-4-hydroxy-6-hydroxymethyldihydropteridine diphosphokinase
MNEVYLSLGSNEGDRREMLRNAIEMLYSSCGQIVKQSSLYETAAWGLSEQPDFLNAAVLVQTELTPIEVLAATHAIEDALGRQRNIKWGQRTLDIDLLLYNDEIINFPDLAIPHPSLQDRRFVLVPLAEIAPEYCHPVLKKTIKELLQACNDPLEVHVKGNLND